MSVLKLLLVEDNPGDARLIQETLADAGDDMFELAHVEDLASGLARLDENEFQLVLLDLDLPDSVGLDTFQQMRVGAPRIPFIVLTGLDDEGLALKAVQLGAQDYLIKGEADSRLLVRAIRYAIEREQTQQKIKALNADLERRVAERTQELAAANQALARINEELRELDRMKTSFIRVTSHELNTPVQVILGMLSLLQQYNPEEHASWERAFKVARRRAIGLQKLVTRILKISQLGEYWSRLERVPVNPDKLVQRVVSEVTPAGSLRSQTLEVEISEGLSDAPMDYDKILDVLLNLVMNAIKFTPDSGTITVSVMSTERHTLQFAVTDTGVGFPQDDVGHVFEEFFSSFDSEHHSSGEYEFGKRGLGLGLAIAKEFVEMHQGRIWLESRPGHGSTVQFEIPSLGESGKAPLPEPA